MKTKNILFAAVMLFSVSSFAGKITDIKTQFDSAFQVNAEYFGELAKFQCTSINKFDKVSSQTYQFLKTNIDGVYKHFKNNAVCKVIACVNYEEQTFALNDGYELESTSPLMEQSALLALQGYDGAVKDIATVRFRQLDQNKMVGMKTVRGGYLWNRHDVVDSMMVCERSK